jgi:hypothetical protein
MNGITSPLEGLQRAEAQIAESAKRLSRLPAAFTSLLESTGGEPVDVVDLSAESVALLQARNAAEANIAAFQTFDQVQQHLLNLLG